MAILALWISRDRTHYAMLRKLDGCYSYTSNGCGSGIVAVESDKAAVATMQVRVDSWLFLPDSAKMPMKRVGPITSPVRIKKGPTYLDGPGAWEVIVNLPVYSAKLAYKAWCKLPEFADFDGRIYRKGGMKAADCTAYYRSKGK